MKRLSVILALILLTVVSGFAAKFEVTGVIVDKSKNPIAKVSVVEKKSKTSVKTDSKGYFKIRLEDSTAILNFKKDGYRNVSFKVNPYLKEHYYFVMAEQVKQKEDKKTKKDKDGVEPIEPYGGEDETVAPPSDGYPLRGFASTEKVAEHSIAASGSFAAEVVYSKSTTFMDKESGTLYAPNAKAGMLTAGDINDYAKWEMWNDIAENDLSAYVTEWQTKPLNRFTLQLETKQKSPIVNATVKLINNGRTVWETRTDNTGKAELWANSFSDDSDLNGTFSIEVEYNSEKHTISQAKRFREGINFLNINENCSKPQNLDIAFVVDATGSMGDEIEYLKAELADIVQKVKDSVSNLDIRTSALFYRDQFDEYLTKHKDFTDNINELVQFIRTNRADGGGDFPEAVDEALDQAVNNLSWRDDALARIIFLVLDAPPHNSPESIKSMQESIRRAAEKGIRVVPLTCSGIDKSTEYLMRSFSVLTNGTYLFLTDDSGIGGKHIEPTTDNFSVNLLNSMLFKTIYQFTYLPECQPEIPVLADTLVVLHPDSVSSAVKGVLPSNENPYSDDNPFDSDNNIAGWMYYPNPTSGILKIEVKGGIEELFVSDITGKIVFRIERSNQKLIEVNLTEYPNGIYFIKYEYATDKWAMGKVILAR